MLLEESYLLHLIHATLGQPHMPSIMLPVSLMLYWWPLDDTLSIIHLVPCTISLTYRLNLNFNSHVLDLVIFVIGAGSNMHMSN